MHGINRGLFTLNVRIFYFYRVDTCTFSSEIQLTVGAGFINLLNLTFPSSMKDDNVGESSTTIRLIEASLGREDVADRANFRYIYSSS